MPVEEYVKIELPGQDIWYGTKLYGSKSDCLSAVRRKAKAYRSESDSANKIADLLENSPDDAFIFTRLNRNGTPEEKADFERALWESTFKINAHKMNGMSPNECKWFFIMFFGLLFLVIVGSSILSALRG